MALMMSFPPPPLMNSAFATAALFERMFNNVRVVHNNPFDEEQSPDLSANSSSETFVFHAKFTNWNHLMRSFIKFRKRLIDSLIVRPVQNSTSSYPIQIYALCSFDSLFLLSCLTKVLRTSRGVSG